MEMSSSNFLTCIQISQEVGQVVCVFPSLQEFSTVFGDLHSQEECEKVGLKLNIQKTKIMTSGPITSWQIHGETMEIVTDCFGGLQNHCRW